MLRTLKSLLVKAIAPAVLVAALASPAPAAGIVVTGVTGNNAGGQVLANSIQGTGVTISNVTYVGITGQGGTFTGGLSSNTGLQFDSGIILTSGSALDAPGPNVSDSQSTSTGTGGDASLNALVGGGTLDRNVLEFDFTTSSGSVFFNFQFGSEEYNEFVGSSFNDVFGFFVDGNNIALIPGTSTPIAINTVNGSTNSIYYNNNDPSDGTPPFDIEYDGLTKMFTVSATGLGSGTHHIKLAIADRSDTVLDSAVFIQSGTFSNTATTPEPTSLTLLGLGVAGLAGYRLRRRKLAA